MKFTYSTGQEARTGDRIKYHGEMGTVEFVALGETNDPNIDWYIQQYPPGGIMISAESFGSVFLPVGDEHEDLDFVSRKET